MIISWICSDHVQAQKVSSFASTMDAQAGLPPLICPEQNPLSTTYAADCTAQTLPKAKA